MTKYSNATERAAEAISPQQAAAASDRLFLSGFVWGLLGVVAFSLTFPATRLAVADIDGAVIGLGRAVVAGLLAGALLLARGSRVPPRHLWLRLVLVALGVVVGFPLFSSLALASVPAAHGAVITGLLPAATAIMAVARAGERPGPLFWLATAAGLAAVLVFAAVQGAGHPQPADVLILIAVVLGGAGYAEGGALARELGGPETICWALILSLPVLAPVTAVLIVRDGGLSAGPAAWAGFAYVSVVSMFLGFFAWYRGLATGGIARIGQLQLAQPVLTLLWSALLLGETVSAGTMLAAVAVLASAALTQFARVRQH
ncbi:MAG TPA: DMT family transporter [Stellaceae bacterium]|jgi:drug/metabolite transporter (DMT)-like permease